jgi:glycosyltransferase involved in cell wall biosynthesis
MRVLVDAVLGPAHPRGVGRYVFELSAHMQRSGEATVTIAIAPWHGDFYAPLVADGVELAEVRVARRRGLRNAWHLYGVGRLARAKRADVIHVPDRLPVAAGAGRPLVITVHDTAEHDLPDAFGRLQLRYRRWVLADQLRRATRIITPSSFSARRIAALAPGAADRTTVVLHGAGLDPAEVQVQPAQVHQDRFVLFVGAVQRHKSVPHLVRAFRALGATDAGLVIAGAVHNDEAAVEAAAESDPRIVRLRDPSDPELAWLYGHAAALAVPSRYEGFCIPLVEAMQLDCPVLAADAGAMPEICGDAALLFAPADEAGLTALLARVLADDALRARLSAAGRQRAAAFSWERAAHETLDVYRAALARDVVA